MKLNPIAKSELTLLRRVINAFAMTFSALLLVVGLSACGGDDGGGDGNGECGVGDGCPCTFTFDCPDPTAEVCQAGVCVISGGGDAGDEDADAGGGDDADEDAGDEDTGDEDAGDDDTGDEDTGDEDAGDDDAGDDDAGDDDAGDDDVEEDTSPVDASDDVEEDTTPTDTSDDTSDDDTTPVDTGGDDTGGEVVFPDAENPWIAFTRRIDGQGQLYFIKADGTGETEFASSNYDSEETPSWSLDGTKLVFTALVFRPLSNNLVVADFEAGTLTEYDPPTTIFDSPTFSPDGNFLVLSGRGGGDSTNDLWTIDLRDGTTEQITSGGDDSSPVWSWDGDTIYFVRTVSDTEANLYRANADGSGAEAVSDANIRGKFTVDGDESTAAFGVATEGGVELRIINVSTGAGVGIGEPGDRSPSFLNSGEQLVVVRQGETSTDTDLVLINLDGDVVTTLVDDGRLTAAPAAGNAEASEIDITNVPSDD